MEVVDRLNDLLTKNYDAEAGYQKAAENAQKEYLKQYFTERAKERYDFGHAIKAEIKNIGGEVDKGTSVKGDVHRIWMDIRDTFGGDDEAVLEECIRGEKTTVDEYRDMLKNTALPESTRTMLINQQTSIERSLNSVKRLEEVQ